MATLTAQTPPRLARAAIIGLTLLVGPISFQAHSQDYVDVEAERAAARRAAAAAAASNPAGTATVPPGVTTSTSAGATSTAPATGTTQSYGVGVAPATTTRSLPPPAPPPADNIGGMFNQVQQLQQEVMRLNGVVEQLTFELNQLKEQSLERYIDLDQRLAAGGGTGTGSTAGGAGSTGGSTGGNGNAGANPIAAGGAGVDTSVAEQPGEGDAYRSAYALVRGQEFDAAVTAFSQFLNRYPDGRYAPNAHYWLGELYLVLDPPDAEASRQSFMLLLNQYPNNAKIPDALYKLGRVHFMKGNSDRSREFLNRAIRDYPDSSAARLAGDFLDQNF